MNENPDNTSQLGTNLYVELAKIHERSIEKRKTVEWKVALSFWAGIALFTWFMTQRKWVGDSLST